MGENYLAVGQSLDFRVITTLVAADLTNRKVWYINPNGDKGFWDAEAVETYKIRKVITPADLSIRGPWIFWAEADLATVHYTWKPTKFFVKNPGET